MNHFNYSLSYETSLELVHNAAKEYFNSAQSFMDDDMNLARYSVSNYKIYPLLYVLMHDYACVDACQMCVCVCVLISYVGNLPHYHHCL